MACESATTLMKVGRDPAGPVRSPARRRPNRGRADQGQLNWLRRKAPPADGLVRRHHTQVSAGPQTEARELVGGNASVVSHDEFLLTGRFERADPAHGTTTAHERRAWVVVEYQSRGSSASRRDDGPEVGKAIPYGVFDLAERGRRRRRRRRWTPPRSPSPPSGAGGTGRWWDVVGSTAYSNAGHSRAGASAVSAL